jgi:tRNA (cytidine/uridine-2'-O-)-methyltransferase
MTGKPQYCHTLPIPQLNDYHSPMSINIVLVEPEIPQNTGNIARTCAAIGAELHLVRPLGFSVDDKYLKRAGLDYWDLLTVSYYDSIDDFLNTTGTSQVVYVTTKADNVYSDFKYEKDCYLVFGKETKGLPEELLTINYRTSVRIPMTSEARSLNLSNSAAIIAYEVQRQQAFQGLQREGHLHRLDWDKP